MSQQAQDCNCAREGWLNWCHAPTCSNYVPDHRVSPGSSHSSFIWQAAPPEEHRPHPFRQLSGRKKELQKKLQKKRPDITYEVPGGRDESCPRGLQRIAPKPTSDMVMADLPFADVLHLQRTVGRNHKFEVAIREPPPPGDPLPTLEPSIILSGPRYPPPKDDRGQVTFPYFKGVRRVEAGAAQSPESGQYGQQYDESSDQQPFEIGVPSAGQIESFEPRPVSPNDRTRPPQHLFGDRNARRRPLLNEDSAAYDNLMPQERLRALADAAVESTQMGMSSSEPQLMYEGAHEHGARSQDASMPSEAESPGHE